MAGTRSVFIALFMMANMAILAQDLRVIDISDTRPSDFPSDGTPLLLGDHEQRPHFFWRTDSRLKVSRVTNEGHFEPLTFAELTDKVSPLVASPRSYWANAVFFWGQQGATQKLWALRDHGEGFALSEVAARTVAANSDLPRFWVTPMGKVGWVVFSHDKDQSPHASLFDFDGTTRDLGPVGSAAHTIKEVRLFERSDLESGSADIVIWSQRDGQDIFELVEIVNEEPGPPRLLLSLPQAPTLTPSIVYTGSEGERTFLAASETQLWWVALHAGQISEPANMDFGVPIEFEHLAVADGPGAYVVRQRDGDAFWWIGVEAPLGSLPFLGGRLPFPRASVPLLSDGAGSWGFLTRTSDGLSWVLRSPGKPDSSSSISLESGLLSWWPTPSGSSAALISWSSIGPIDGVVLTPYSGLVSVMSETDLIATRLFSEQLDIANPILTQDRPGFFWYDRPIFESTDPALKWRKSWNLNNTVLVLKETAQ